MSGDQDVMCADGCSGCSAECAACASGCFGCSGCDSGRLAVIEATARAVERKLLPVLAADPARQARVAAAVIAAEGAEMAMDEALDGELAFNPHQPRDAKGRWTKGAPGGGAPNVTPRPRPLSEPEGTPTPGTAKTKRAVKPRTAKVKAAPAAAPDESEKSPDMGDEYIPQHLADVRDYLDGKKNAPLPLSYLYGGVSKESWRKFFSPGQRARVLRESREIRDGMSDDARDKSMLDRAVGWLEEIAEEEKPGFVPSASRKVQDHLAGKTSSTTPLPVATLYGQVEPQSWRDHFTPKQRAKALREMKRELKKIQKGPKYKGRYSDEGLLDRTIRLLEGIESEQRTNAAPPPSGF